MPTRQDPSAQSPTRRRRMAVWGLALALAATPPAAAWATIPDTGLEGRAVQVSDEDLGEMRGKFVGSGGVAYFSVELRSAWTNAQGVTVAGVLTMSLDLRSSADDARAVLPVVMIGWSRDCASCGDLEPGANPPGGLPVGATGGPGSFHGVVQSQEIRGSDNVVQNGLRINVMPAHLVDSTPHGGLTPATGNSTQVLANGAAVHFQITGSQLGVALQNGDQAGLVGQMVNSSQNQISQNALLTSDFNTVHNTIDLTVGVDQMRQSEITNIQHSMSVLKGLGY